MNFLKFQQNPVNNKFEDFFDEEGKQLRPLPDNWINLSKRFKVGQQIRYLKSKIIYIGPRMHSSFEARRQAENDPANWYDMRGELGEIIKVRDGTKHFPPRWYPDDSDEGGNWIGDSRGWLTVRFPRGSGYGFEKDGTAKPIALRVEDEKTEWELVR